MALFFAANAIWWAYRVGSTIGTAYLDWEAARRGTTLDAAFERARKRGLAGEFTLGEALLLQFVNFNRGRAYTSVLDFIIDTSAMTTAGAGLIGKAGLGERIAVVMGIKSAETSGALIDGIIDLAGSMIQGGNLNIGDVLKNLLDFSTQTREDLDPALQAGLDVVTAATSLGTFITPFLGVTSGAGLVGAALKTVISAPAIIDAVGGLFAAIGTFFGIIEEQLPEQHKPKVKTIVDDPHFRDAIRDAQRRVIKGTDPGFFASKSGKLSKDIKSDIRLTPGQRLTGPIRRRIAQNRERYGQIQAAQLLPEGAAGRLDPRTFIPLVTALGPQADRRRFVQAFGGRVGASELAGILEELKKGGRRSIPKPPHPFTRYEGPSL